MAKAFGARFVGWNIDQANREERHPETCWDRRSEEVKALIGRTQADIVALVELRNLKTAKETAQMFLQSFWQYHSVLRWYCHYGNSFAMAILYDHEKFFLGDVRVHNFDGNPDDDKMVMFADFQCKATMKWFTIGVTHFALQEDRKDRSTQILGQLIADQAHPCWVYGDYNFFDDKKGKDQRKYLEDMFPDVAHPLHREDGKTPLSGTFIGFAHDDFKYTFDNMSRLDHVFATGAVSQPAISPDVSQFEFDNSAYEGMTYPSDHLAIQLELELP